MFYFISIAASIPLRVNRGARVYSSCLHFTAGPPRDKQEFAHTPANHLEFQVGPSLDYGRKLEPQQGTQTATQYWEDKHTRTPLRESSEPPHPPTLLLLGDSVNFCSTKDDSLHHKTSR